MKPLAGHMTPPPVPMPPRLPTPDLSDVDEVAFWSCCSYSSSNKYSTHEKRCDGYNDDDNDDYNDEDNDDENARVWNSMGERPSPPAQRSATQ